MRMIALCAIAVLACFTCQTIYSVERVVSLSFIESDDSVYLRQSGQLLQAIDTNPIQLNGVESSNDVVVTFIRESQRQPIVQIPTPLSGVTESTLTVPIDLVECPAPNKVSLYWSVSGGGSGEADALFHSGARYLASLTPTVAGTYVVTAEIMDPTRGVLRSASMTIEVAQANRGPSADAKSLSLAEDSSKTVQFSGSDPDDDILSFEIVSGPSDGSLENLGDGLFRYTPNADYHGSDSFSYRAYDGALYSTPATVSIAVSAVQDPPVAEDATELCPEDGILMIDLPMSDVDGDELTFSVTSQVNHGTLTIVDADTVRYQPDADYDGEDGFTFTVSDGQATTGPATITITIIPSNDVPVLGAINDFTAEAGLWSANQVLDLSDVETATDQLQVIATSSDQGIIPDDAINIAHIDGVWTLQCRPVTGVTGSTAISVTVTDSGGESAQQDAEVTVSPVLALGIDAPDTVQVGATYPVDITYRNLTDVDETLWVTTGLIDGQGILVATSTIRMMGTIAAGTSTTLAITDWTLPTTLSSEGGTLSVRLWRSDGAVHSEQWYAYEDTKSVTIAGQASEDAVRVFPTGVFFRPDSLPARLSVNHDNSDAAYSSTSTATNTNITEAASFAQFGGEATRARYVSENLRSATFSHLLYEATGSNGQVFSFTHDAEFGQLLSASYDQLASIPLGTRIPLIIIHGWQGDKDQANYVGCNTPTSMPEAYFQEFLTFVNSSPAPLAQALRSKYKLYLYKYPSFEHITYNGRMLGECIAMLPELRDYVLGGGKIDILAHSMGGLVSRSFIEEHGLCEASPSLGTVTAPGYDAVDKEYPGTRRTIAAGDQVVSRLITLATPHHGSPGAGLGWVDVLNATEWIKAKWRFSPGALDLMWNDFDGGVTNRIDDVSSDDTSPYSFPERYSVGDGVRDGLELFSRRHLLNLDGSFIDASVDFMTSVHDASIQYSHPNPWLASINKDLSLDGSDVRYYLYAGGIMDIDFAINEPGDLLKNGSELTFAADEMREDAQYGLNDAAVPTRSALLDFSGSYSWVTGLGGDDSFHNVSSKLDGHVFADPYADGYANFGNKPTFWRFFQDYSHDQMRGGSGAVGYDTGFVAGDYNVGAWKDPSEHLPLLYAELGLSSVYTDVDLSQASNMLFYEPLFLQVASDLVDVSANGWASPDVATIPAGTFTQGDQTGDGQIFARPVRQVTISQSFKLATTEVTNAQYANMLNWALDPNGDGIGSDAYIEVDNLTSPTTVRLVDTDPRDGTTAWLQQEVLNLNSQNCQIVWEGSDFGIRDVTGHPDGDIDSRANHPVVEVTWYGSQFFCWAQNVQAGSSHNPISLVDWSVDTTKAGWRLPTEAEWEYAARGGWDGGAKYSWWTSDVATQTEHDGSQANGLNDGDAYDGLLDYNYTTPVGSYAANGFGLFDMSGNVWELCSDWFNSDAYDSDTDNDVGEHVVDPIGPTEGSDHVIRGGSWYDTADLLRCATRGALMSSASDFITGFRPAKGQGVPTSDG